MRQEAAGKTSSSCSRAVQAKETSTLAIPRCPIQMNLFSCWNAVAGKPVRFKLNNPPSQQRCLGRHLSPNGRSRPGSLGRRSSGGNGIGDFDVNNASLIKRGVLKAIGAYVSFQTADTHWSNEKISPSTRRTTSNTASHPSLRVSPD